MSKTDKLMPMLSSTQLSNTKRSTKVFAFGHLSWLFVLFALSFMMACKPRIPNGVLSKSKMEEVLYDYHLAQCAAEADGPNMVNRYLYVQSVFQKHGITEAEFDSSMVWYSANAQILEKIYENLHARLSAESKSLGVGVSDTEMYANMTEEGDTANIWAGSRFLILENNRLHNFVTLNMIADSTFLPGDTYKLSFFANFMGRNAREAYAFLNIQFTDGSIAATSQRLSSNYSVMMNLSEKAKGAEARAERITVTFFMPYAEKPSEPEFFYVTNPALLRIHEKKVEPVAEVPADSIAEADSTLQELGNDHLDTTHQQRLSPEQLRDSKHVDREINIVKEKPLAPRRKVTRSVRRK